MIEYTYSNKNLFEFPQKYQMSPYHGVQFLKAYESSRKKILEKLKLSDAKNYRFHNILAEKYSGISSNIRFDEKINTFEFFNYLLKRISDKVIDQKSKEKLDQLVKTFEVKKKIFSKYGVDMKENSSDYASINLYLLFSLICLKFYELNKNLKYLNTSLKLNDIICSQVGTYDFKNDLELFALVIHEEMSHVINLCKQKGVKL